VTGGQGRQSYDWQQRRLMIGALCLLVLALGIVLWHDRDFWFGDDAEADAEEVQSAAAANAGPVQPSNAVTADAKPTSPVKATRHRSARAQARKNVAVADNRYVNPPAVADSSAAPPGAIITRTVLPPLEVEVIAGDKHRTLRPGSNSVSVDMEPDPPSQNVDAAVVNPNQTAASVTSNAAERVQMSVDTAQAVARPVRPNYPLLARQMKVQGSVILQALVGRDGAIQNLRVVSGPPILATAAQDAVRQWHFKPHLEGSEAVETQAKITVNFTISTN
jgi:TonB family protein